MQPKPFWRSPKLSRSSASLNVEILFEPLRDQPSRTTPENDKADGRYWGNYTYKHGRILSGLISSSLNPTHGV